MNIMKLLMVTAVGLGLGAVTKGIGRPIVTGALLYVIGAIVGSKYNVLSGVLGGLQLKMAPPTLKLPPRYVQR